MNITQSDLFLPCRLKFIIKAQDDIFVHMIYCPFQGKSCRNVFLERHVRHISCLVDYFYMYFLHSDRKKIMDSNFVGFFCISDI